MSRRVAMFIRRWEASLDSTQLNSTQLPLSHDDPFAQPADPGPA